MPESDSDNILDHNNHKKEIYFEWNCTVVALAERWTDMADIRALPEDTNGGFLVFS